MKLHELSPRLREIDIEIEIEIIVCFFHLRIIAPMLSPSHQAACLVALSSLVEVYNFVLDIIGQLFGLGHGGEFGI